MGIKKSEKNKKNVTMIETHPSSVLSIMVRKIDWKIVSG
jgi:hypothetical protein